MTQLVFAECVRKVVPVRIINLTPIEANCAICWTLHYFEHCLPMYEDEIVDIDRTNEWAGQPVCPSCYERYKDHLGKIHDLN